MLFLLSAADGWLEDLFDPFLLNSEPSKNGFGNSAEFLNSYVMNYTRNESETADAADPHSERMPDGTLRSLSGQPSEQKSRKVFTLGWQRHQTGSLTLRIPSRSRPHIIQKTGIKSESDTAVLKFKVNEGIRAMLEQTNRTLRR